MNRGILSIVMVLALTGVAASLELRGPVCQVSAEIETTAASSAWLGALELGSCVDPLMTNDGCFAQGNRLAFSGGANYRTCRDPYALVPYCLDKDGNGFCENASCSGLLICNAVDVGSNVQTGRLGPPTSPILHCEAHQFYDENGVLTTFSISEAPRGTLLLVASDPESFEREIADCEAGYPYRLGYEGLSVGMDPELGL